MNARRLLIVGAMVALAVTEGASHDGRRLSPQKWHTRPDRWREPRNYHTPFDGGYECRLSVTRQKNESENRAARRFSPNNAYWIASSGQLPVRFTPETPVLIFNERPHVIRVAPTKDDPDYFLKRIEWVNEKLVYSEVWWGRALGTCYILDVEREAIVHREMVHDGSQPFRQWHRPTDRPDERQPAG